MIHCINRDSFVSLLKGSDDEDDWISLVDNLLPVSNNTNGDRSDDEDEWISLIDNLPPVHINTSGDRSSGALQPQQLRNIRPPTRLSGIKKISKKSKNGHFFVQKMMKLYNDINGQPFTKRAVSHFKGFNPYFKLLLTWGAIYSDISAPDTFLFSAAFKQKIDEMME